MAFQHVSESSANKAGLYVVRILQGTPATGITTAPGSIRELSFHETTSDSDCMQRTCNYSLVHISSTSVHAEPFQTNSNDMKLQLTAQCDGWHQAEMPCIKGLYWEPQTGNPKNIVGIYEEHTYQGPSVLLYSYYILGVPFRFPVKSLYCMNPSNTPTGNPLPRDPDRFL